MSFNAVLDTVLLGALHGVNYAISNTVVDGAVIPLLSRGYKEQEELDSLNTSLYRLGISYKVKQYGGKPAGGRERPSLFSPTTWKARRNSSTPKDNASHSVISSISHLFFNLALSFSLQITQLFLCDSAGLLESPVRSFDWTLTLSVLTLLLSYVIPSWMLQCWLWEKRQGSRRPKMFLALYTAVVCVWCVALNFVSLRKSGMGFFELSLYRLTLVGITCLAVVNGAGCVSCILRMYNQEWRHVTKDEVLRTVRTLRSTEALIDTRQNTSDEHELLLSSHSDLVAHLEHVVDAVDRQTNYKTVGGRARMAGDISFAAYCLYRVVTIFLLQLPLILLSDLGIVGRSHANKSPASEPDPLSKTVSKLLVQVFNKELDARKLSMLINMVFAMCLFFGSFNSVAITFSKLGKLASRHHTGAGFSVSYLYNLVVAETTGVYILSTMLILDRGGMKSELTDSFLGSELMSADFVNVLYSRWFGISCIAICAGLVLMSRYEKQFGKVEEEWDEEKVLS